MTRRRWIADRWEGSRAYLTGANAEHLARVLRARVGQEFEIATGKEVRLGRISAVSVEEVAFDLGGAVEQAEPGRVSLLLAVFKFDRMEWAIEKATELGVAEITPAICRRTDAHLASAATKRAERWRRIAREAAQQARRTSPPEIVDPVDLKSALAIAADVKIVLSEQERSQTLIHGLQQASARDTVALAIGPEGGWTEEELQAFTGNGWVAASLGPTVLRAETAAIAAVAISQSVVR